jgi:hypothetical protein
MTPLHFSRVSQYEILPKTGLYGTYRPGKPNILYAELERLLNFLRAHLFRHFVKRNSVLGHFAAQRRQVKQPTQ